MQLEGEPEGYAFLTRLVLLSFLVVEVANLEGAVRVAMLRNCSTFSRWFSLQPCVLAAERINVRVMEGVSIKQTAWAWISLLESYC